jgi:hypothetical protein
VYVVRISGALADFHERLRTVDGAALVRELPPDRVVVTLPSTARPNPGSPPSTVSSR